MILTSPLLAAANEPREIQITEPFHGAVLNWRHGEKAADGLKIRVTGKAVEGSRVNVNGVAAQRQGANFHADVVLEKQETNITAAVEGKHGARRDRVRVVWDRHSRPRYGFSIDDSSFFLRDITRKGYASLFDCFFLKMLRDLHRQYLAKFVLNIYYTTGDGFSLPQFPDRYESEWRDNADWLRLAFHAHADKPDRPYQDAPPERLIADFDKVAEQIVRFAGEETYCPPTYTHFAMVRPSAYKPLAERGVRVLSGYFIRNKGKWDINYNLDDRRSEYLSRHEALKDFDSGIVFSRTDMVCNLVPLDGINAALEPLAQDPNLAEVMDLITHEQYFWPFYRSYLPDHPKRLDTALRWLTERGYRPVFLHEGLLGGPT